MLSDKEIEKIKEIENDVLINVKRFAKENPNSKNNINLKIYDYTYVDSDLYEEVSLFLL